MILVDSSVWIDHFRTPNRHLVALLESEEVCGHPFILGELSCGNLQNRKEIISLLHALPTVRKAGDDEILFFIERHRLSGRGIGLIDVHLLASCLIDRCHLWTSDRRLQSVAKDLSIDSSQQPDRYTNNPPLAGHS